MPSLAPSPAPARACPHRLTIRAPRQARRLARRLARRHAGIYFNYFHRAGARHHEQDIACCLLPAARRLLPAVWLANAGKLPSRQSRLFPFLFHAEACAAGTALGHDRQRVAAKPVLGLPVTVICCC